MFADPNPAMPTRGAEAVEAAIARGVDLEGSPIPPKQLELYRTVMELEAERPHSGVTNTLRDRIVRIGSRHFPQSELDRWLSETGFEPLSSKEIAFFYGEDETEAQSDRQRGMGNGERGEIGD
ncbi:MAG: DUF4090 family protein [Cyanobacteria bacterium SID2]|nr:DUF4090 family protein [Cyanobacteria bacterium SID2]MBP0004036.1 DUF4090 family protein [Cyanobacteria bacterium SBC]